MIWKALAVLGAVLITIAVLDLGRHIHHRLVVRKHVHAYLAAAVAGNQQQTDQHQAHLRDLGLRITHHTITGDDSR